MNNYKPFTEEIITYKNIDCDYYGLLNNEPCWGKVIKDKLYCRCNEKCNYYDEYYVCKGHYKCVKGGKYEPYPGL